jgi:hypothetical protein
MTAREGRVRALMGKMHNQGAAQVRSGE